MRDRRMTEELEQLLKNLKLRRMLEIDDAFKPSEGISGPGVAYVNVYWCPPRGEPVPRDSAITYFASATASPTA